jgi:hypothetical protein
VRASSVPGATTWRSTSLTKPKPKPKPKPNHKPITRCLAQHPGGVHPQGRQLP